MNLVLRAHPLADDMIIFRAVNLYPSQIDEILSVSQGVGSEYQIHLARSEEGRDSMILRVEREEGLSPDGDKDLATAIRADVKRLLLVTPEVEIVGYGDLPRSDRKSKRVFDNRID
jgi:phenylacetate-CoA ligase